MLARVFDINSVAKITCSLAIFKIGFDIGDVFFAESHRVRASILNLLAISETLNFER